MSAHRAAKKPSGAPRGGPKTTGELVAMLEAEGCTVTPARRGGHPVVRLPTGRRTTIAATPSDHRSLRNTVARLRRKYGLLLV